MLITKFNKMIRNKFVWGFFGGIVALFFVGSSISLRGCRKQQSQGRAGTLFGEDVSERDLNIAAFYESRMQNQDEMSDEARDYFRERAWQRLAALRAAGQFGLAVSDRELGNAIRSNPSFARNGSFDVQAYHLALRNNRMSPDTYESLMRQEMTLQKLKQLFQSMTWTAPADVDRRLADLTDRYTVDCAVIARTNVEVTAEISDADIESFYEDNQSLFSIPEKMRVRYVAFDITNHLAAIEVKAADVLAYYNDNLDDYRKPGTNDTMVTQPLDEVRDEITRQLTWEQATFATKRVATDFARALAPGSFGVGATEMGVAAERFGVALSTTRYFSASEELAELGVDREFTTEAFDIDPEDKSFYFSDAVVGSNRVFILATCGDRQESTIPELADVIERVRPLVLTNALDEAFMAKAGEVRDDIRKAVDGGQTFSNAVAEAGFNVATGLTFSVREAFSGMVPYAPVIVPALRQAATGDLTDALRMGPDAMLAYVRDRRPDPLAAMRIDRRQLVGQSDQYQAGVLFDEWGEYALRTDAVRPKDSAAPDPEAEPAEGEAAPAGDARSAEGNAPAEPETPAADQG